MLSNTLLLLKTFLKSTSNIHVLRFSNDKAKRKYATNSLVGQIILNVVLVIYTTMLGLGLVNTGLAEVIPQICAIILFMLPFIFTLLKANGYLFGFKEYDMIMAMPFSAKSIVSGRFWYMYIKSMPMFGMMSLAMLIGYAIGGYFTLLKCFLWGVMTLALPVIPMVIASALGAIIVKIGENFRHKNIVQAVATAIIILPLFFIRYFVEDTIQNDHLDDMMNLISDSVNRTAAYIPCAKWFSDAINEGVISSFLLLLATAIIVYELFFILISRFYRKMNSQLSAGTHSKKFALKEQKQQGMVQSVAYKEFKRMTGSSIYLLNAGLGYVMVILMGIAFLFVKPEDVIKVMMQGAPIEASLIFPGVTLLLYFFIGMVPTTACSPSLEGKNYWIMQTLPIHPMDDNKGKLLFNLYLSIPSAVFAMLAASFCFKVSIMDAITSVIAVCSLCLFSTVNGLRSGLKHRRLDWENEIEVIKQGMAVSMYIIPHIIIGIVLMPLVVVANYYFHNVAVIMLFISVFAWILTIFAWSGVKKYTKFC